LTLLSVERFSVNRVMDSPLKAFLDGRIEVWQGDITQQDVEAIVNAANTSLLGGGGVDGAIHRAGGPEILEACREIRRTAFPEGLPTGEAVLTTAGKLRAKYVIHTVGPVYDREQGREAELLAACYRNSLRVAVENAVATIAFPAISTGVFGYPREEAAKVASEAIRGFLAGDASINAVRLVFFSGEDAEVFLAAQQF